MMSKTVISLSSAAVALALTCGSVTAQVAVKIGVMSDMTGPYADFSGPGSLEAVRMAVEDFRAVNRALAVEVVSADPQNKPDNAATVARRWFDTENVDLIIDVPTSGVALAVAGIAKEKNKVMIATTAGTSDITGKACTPNTLHWVWDTWSSSHGTAEAVVKSGGKSWYFLTADYTFGTTMEREASDVVKANGGTILGSVRHPLGATDFSSFLLQAQNSKAQIIGLANGGADTINAIKTAGEFGIVAGGQKLVGLIVFINDIHALGLKSSHGLQLTTAFYWDLNDKTRTFGERFAKRMDGKMPSMSQAGSYSATFAYLNAVAKTGSAKDGAAVVSNLRAAGVFDDPLFGKTSVRADGRVIHDMYLVEVKKPDESKKPWDYYKVVSVMPGDKAFRPLSEGACPLAK
ncbi:ABC transporter substrate-binding protein [Bradyrhizobium sp. G127]|jgi:branched-chain amino acid transport system substrate-binding protein|uniref:ABC transporter substrate-binding protein n=1 Tax=Bradyrhizobium sp. G127 TaxID=2904800 RepID=UPI001F44B645|nr:ABC transporter substrate-binding protein [Bradyrhizobium sp. G127]MCF2521839.1 ABC transporter substrate-binding protein [Bradyrhizobium sp. G127]